MGLYNLSCQTEAFFTYKGTLFCVKFVIIELYLTMSIHFPNSSYKKRSNSNRIIYLILSMALGVHASSFSPSLILLVINGIKLIFKFLFLMTRYYVTK